MNGSDHVQAVTQIRPLLARELEPCLWYPERLVWPNSWAAHIPFAFWMIQALRPSVIVELGVHTGNSYAAFCQAVKLSGAPASCFGVDTWQGDEHAGLYGDDVYGELVAWHDAHCAGFSRLIRSTFDEAAAYFAPGTIDVLHIDGLHTYEAVRHDFETWRPLLSDRALVLFHDTNVRERGFGVWRLWKELAAQHRSFEFVHGHGLGVLGVGSDLPPALLALFDAASQPDELCRLRDLFSRLGVPLMRDILLGAAEADVARLTEAERAATSARSEAEQTVVSIRAQAAHELAEAQAQAQRGVAEAQSQAQRGVAEAQAQAHRDVAEARAQAEHAVAEAAAKVVQAADDASRMVEASDRALAQTRQQAEAASESAARAHAAQIDAEARLAAIAGSTT